MTVSAETTDTAKASQATKPSTSTGRGARATPRRLIAQPTRLEAVDDPLGPLGGTSSAGESQSDEPPAPPKKEGQPQQLASRTNMPASQHSSLAHRPRGHDDAGDDDDDELVAQDMFDGRSGPRQPPPVQAAQPSPMNTAVQPSISVEQAAKPTFHIVVGDPHKVGDLTSSHIVYSVRTKASLLEDPP